LDLRQREASMRKRRSVSFLAFACAPGVLNFNDVVTGENVYSKQ
jgi:hypothetical protein